MPAWTPTPNVSITNCFQPTRTPLLTGHSPDVTYAQGKNDHGQNVAAKRDELLHYFQQTFDLYDALFDCLGTQEAWFEKSIPLRHPLIFYYGHTASFFINKLMAGQWLTERIDPEIESIMAIGVDEMSWDDLDATHYRWPSVDRVREYRQHVRQRISQFIREMPLELPISWESPAWAILMGVEHERIHLETSSVLIRQLPIERVLPNTYWSRCPFMRTELSQVPENQLIPVAAVTVQQGKPERDATYGWDNEYGSRTIRLEAFQASQYLVSNAEFLEFVESGGYQDPQWWTEEGWSWVQYSKAIQPTFWIGSPQQPSELKLRLMCQQIPMPWDWPVETNQLEAAAFCRWKASQTGLSIQLPSEAEWMALRNKIEADQPTWYKAPGNINLEYWASSCPVDHFPQGDGFYDVIGNVWQWTSTAIDGFDGFRVHPLYDDFSTPTFDGKHNLIKGGSWISTGNLAIHHSRYAFRRHFFQHAGFRYVESHYQEPSLVSPYEADPEVAEMLENQYGRAPLTTIHPLAQIAKIARDFSHQQQRVLDLGCGTGRCSFELAKYFHHVDAVDYTARFIDIAETLVRQQSFRYACRSEGDLLDYKDARLEICNLPSELTKHIEFTQGDACNLKEKYSGYDVIIAANLLDQVREPTRFLLDMSHRLNPEGILLILSAYQWQEHKTPKTNWLGGIRENGEALLTYPALQRLLLTSFEEIAAPIDIPQMLYQSARQYCYQETQLSIWRKRD